MSNHFLQIIPLIYIFAFAFIQGGCGSGNKDTATVPDDSNNVITSSDVSTSSSISSILSFDGVRKVGNCPLFSAEYFYNQAIDDIVKYPVAQNSTAIMRNIGRVGYPPVLSTETPMLRLVDDSQASITLKCATDISWCKSTTIGSGVKIPYPQDLTIASNTDRQNVGYSMPLAILKFCSKS